VKEFFKDCTYLEDEGLIIEGVTLWGTPYNRGSSGNNAFQDKPEERLKAIPSNLGILMTHGPVDDKFINAVKPTVHLWGHLHNYYGISMVGHTVSINASSLDGDYKYTHAPIIIDIKKGETKAKCNVM